MFERFTSGARASLVSAQRHANHLRHSFIYREHLLMTLLDDAEAHPDGICAAILESGGAPRVDWGLLVVQAAEQREADARAGSPEREESSCQQFTLETKKVLELSLREALQLGHNYIAEFHLLLALIQSAQDSDAAWSTLIDNGGLEIERARYLAGQDARGAETARRPGAGSRLMPGRVPSRSRESSRPTGRRPRVGPVSDGYRAAVNRAEKFSSAPTTTGDLLLALLDIPGTHVELVLANVGLPDRAVLEAELDRLRATETPDGFAEPRVRVHRRSGSIIIRDPRIAELMSKPVESQTQEEHDLLSRLVDEALRAARTGDVDDDDPAGADE